VACSSGQPRQDEFQKRFTEPERAYMQQVEFPAGGAPAKSGEESNTAYCQWLIGQQPALRGVMLRLIYALTTYVDRYPKGTTIGVINTIRVADPQNRLFESSTAIARVQSSEATPRVLLNAAVEERKAGNEDVACVHYVCRKFVYAEKTWSLVESHVLRVP
jgi:hypothetical protein